MVVLGGGGVLFLMSEVPLYSGGSPRVWRSSQGPLQTRPQPQHINVRIQGYPPYKKMSPPMTLP